MKKNKITTLLPVLTFLVLVFGIAIWCAVKPDTKMSETENRFLAQKPEFSVDAVMDGSFESKYETYLTDQFILRDQFIALKSMTEKAMQKSDIKDLYLCKDNYLIRRYTEESFNKEQVSTNVSALGEFVTHYAGIMGTDHVKAAIVPSAAMVLTDKLPKFATPYDESQVIAQIENVVPKNTLVDLTEPLKEHKDEYIYFKTDHHWTPLGAYYGYEAWAKSAGLTPTPLDQFEKETFTTDFLGTNHSKICYAKEADTIDLYKPDVTCKVLYDDLWSSDKEKPEDKISDTMFVTKHKDEKDKYQVFLDGNHALVDIKTSVKNGKKLLLIKDSYAHCMVPYLATQFEQITMVDTRYYNSQVSTLKPEENYTDILVLRNTDKFMLDDSVFKLMIQ